jgi:hypothetical protein
MSDEFNISRSLESRVQAFWDCLRACDLRESGAHGAVFLLCFLHRRGKVLLSHPADAHVLEREIFSYVGEGSLVNLAVEAYRELTRGVHPNALLQLFRDLSVVIEGLSDLGFRQVATAILDEIPQRRSWDHFDRSLPSSVAEFMVAAVSPPAIEASDLFSPYVPHPIIARLGQHSDLQVQNVMAAANLAVHLMVSGTDAQIQVVDGENVWNGFGRGYQRVVAAPPLGKKLPRNHWSGLPDVESYAVQQVAEMLKPGAMGAVCVSPGFLFRATPAVAGLRRSLVESKRLKCVVQLPARLSSTMALPPVILVLGGSEERTDGVRVVDASDCIARDGRDYVFLQQEALERLDDWTHPKSRSVPSKELARGNFDLSPARYFGGNELVDLPGHQWIQLKDLTSQVTAPRARRGDRGVYLPRRSFPEAVDRFEETFESAAEIPFEAIDRPRQPKLVSTDCLLVDMMASRGELRAIWFKFSGKSLFIEPEILALEVNQDRVDGGWLVLALRSESVTKQVRDLLVGGAIPRLRTELLMEIRVAVPNSRDQQRSLLKSAEELQFRARAKEIGLEKILNNQRLGFTRNLRLKKHSLAQVANDIKGRISTVAKLLERQGRLVADEMVGKLDPLPAAEYLRQIANRCGDLGAVLEGLTHDYRFHPVGPLDLDVAFRELRDSCKGRNFKAEVEIHKQTFVDPLTSKHYKRIIRIAREDFAELCENIIENAIRHGFSESEREHAIRIEASFLGEEQMVELSFKNNGNPLPEGLTTERFVLNGEIAGPTGHTGAGGYHIKTLMEHVGGSVEIRNLQESYFTVELRLLFPFES